MTYLGFLLVRVRLCATFYFNALIVKLRCALMPEYFWVMHGCNVHPR